jgi:hypothetical protein
MAFKSNSQIGNYVSNGSFESLNSNSLTSLYNAVNYWQPIDSGKYMDYLVTALPPINNVPYAAGGFQYPRTGHNYILSGFYCSTCSFNERGYPRNRLRQPLKANATYCLKYYVVNCNHSNVAIDAFGAYFTDVSIDTINYCNLPLTYITPQIQYIGGVITDTLNWRAMTGTFVATGVEKYLVLGNFKSNAATNTILINQPSNIMGADICIDDVSLIELNLPAYAGPDVSIVPGDSAFIGREPDFAIDPGCIWYKLPNMTAAIDTISGLWVKPTVTTTYVVRQELDCSPLKWDTVVVYMNPVGLEKLKLLNEELEIYPIPANEKLELRIGNIDLIKKFESIAIFNSLGQMVREEEILIKEKTLQINTNDLSDGIYFLQLRSSDNEIINKRFVINR